MAKLQCLDSKKVIDSNEVCELMNISKAVLTRLKREAVDMPAPLSNESGFSCVWERQSMQVWIEKNKRPKTGVNNTMALSFLRGLHANKNG